MIKTENEIYKDLTAFVNSALAAFNISGWEIFVLTQPLSALPSNPSIYVSCISKRRYGSQFRKYKVNEDRTMSHIEIFIQEIEVAFGAYKGSETIESEESLNGADILEYLKTCFLSREGLQMIRDAGYQIYQPSQIKNPDFLDKSENAEVMPFFKVTFALEQSTTTLQKTVEEIIDKNIIEIQEIKGV